MSDQNSSHSSFLGLGYHSRSNNSDTNESPSTFQSSTRSTTPTFSVDFILQQCLQYHQEQECVRQQQQQQQQHDNHVEEEQSKNEIKVTTAEELSPNVINFVAATRSDMDVVENYCTAPQQNQKHQESAKNVYENPEMKQVQESSGSNDSISTEQNHRRQHEQLTTSMEEKLLLARSIISRFNMEREVMLMDMMTKPRTNDVNNPSALDDTLLTLPPFTYAEQRRIAFEKENMRLQSALLSNYDYVQKKDDEKIELLEKKVKESEEFEQMAAEHYSQRVLMRQQRIQQQISSAGIGTKERQKLDQKIQKERKQKPESSTVAVYVCGLPQDEKFDNVETLLHHLFGAYGKIQKIHLYKEKTNQSKLKGDGLIIYNCPLLEQISLIDTVCDQLNGAELANGNVLRVEPSDSNYVSRAMNLPIQVKSRNDRNGKSLEAQENQLHESSEIVAASVVNEEVVNDGNDNDLDDFFDSL